ncbi:trafficking protein particle complex subunit 6B-like isoform X1 [Tachypleus tridentatus]|uniref:trafficking protein particle complex subunit 6B-like isoform X1 n=1 Tax=Tachypleus tridentatus TaxID=6853 RepID=UPI003FCF3AFA
MKFICKELWLWMYKKQIDNLRTNHQKCNCFTQLLQGVYVLQDNSFRFLTQLSQSKQYVESTYKYLAFSCGVIRGALSNLDIICVVTAEVSSPPACKFQVQVQRI